MRVGQGYDAHRFKDGTQVVLGGVEIPFEFGLAAHSDGDVLLHAVCDALLGAAALGDIGRHFPDSDPAYKGVSSRVLLRRVKELLDDAGLQIINIDAVAICERPRMKPHREAMRLRTADVLGLPLKRVSVKATTTEEMGFTGRGEGLAAHATATVLLPD